MDVNICHNLEDLEQIQGEFKKWKYHTFEQVVTKKKEIMVRLGGILRCTHGGNNHA